MSRTCFRMNPHCIVHWMSRNPFVEGASNSESEVTPTGVDPKTTCFLNEHSTIWPNWPTDSAAFWVLICTVHLIVCPCHVTYVFPSESTLYSCLNVKEVLARRRREIWRWSDCHWTPSQNHLVLKWTLIHLAIRFKTKWFWVRVQLQSFHLQILSLLRARSSLTFRQL